MRVQLEYDGKRAGNRQMLTSLFKSTESEAEEAADHIKSSAKKRKKSSPLPSLPQLSSFPCSSPVSVSMCEEPETPGTPAFRPETPQATPGTPASRPKTPQATTGTPAYRPDTTGYPRHTGISAKDTTGYPRHTSISARDTTDYPRHTSISARYHRLPQAHQHIGQRHHRLPQAHQHIGQTPQATPGTPAYRPETPQATPGIPASHIQKLMLELEAVKGMVRTNTVYLKKLLDKQQSEVVEEGCLENFGFPLTCESGDVEKVEVLLQDRSLEKCLLNHLRSLGGFSAKDVISRIMANLMTNALACQFNWHGKGQKQGLRRLHLSKVIKDAAKSNNLSECDAEDALKKWLKYAKDRDGGRKKRLEKKREKEAAMRRVDNITGALSSSEESD